MASRMAGTIKVIREKNTARIEIDGEEFPYFTLPGGWTVNVARDQCPGVTLTIAADRVEVVNDLSGISAVTPQDDVLAADEAAV